MFHHEELPGTLESCGCRLQTRAGRQKYLCVRREGGIHGKPGRQLGRIDVLFGLTLSHPRIAPDRAPA
jgi:hypothetical protein